MNRPKKTGIFIIIIVAILYLAACQTKDDKLKKIKDIDYTVVVEADIPEGLKKIIEEKKENPFKLSYGNNESLYLAIGYGKQTSGGYSITVKELYLTENAIYVDTDLIGPQKEEVTETVTYPYIILKMEFIDKEAVMEWECDDYLTYKINEKTVNSSSI